MTATTAATVTVPVDRIRQAWATTVTVAKTIIVLLAIVGAVQLTAPLRADAAPTPATVVVKPGTATQGK